MFFVSTEALQDAGIEFLEAVKERLAMIKEKNESPKMILFFSYEMQMKELAELLEQSFPTSVTMGVYAYQFMNGRILQKGVTFFVFEREDELQVEPGLILNASSCPVRSIGEIEEAVERIQPGEEDTLCVEFTTAGEEMVVTTLNAAFDERKIPLIGGTINDSHNDMMTGVVYNGTIYDDACIYFMIKNQKGRIRVYSESIFSKLDDKPHCATKVNVKKKALIEIDGKPAADVIAKEVGVDRNEVASRAMKNPLGRIVGNANYIIAMHDMDEDGTLYNHKQVNLNDIIYIMKREDYRQVFQETLKKITEETKEIGYVFSIDCINRCRMYTEHHYFEQYVKEWNQAVAHNFGLVSAGEQFCRQHINQAMVCAVFEKVQPVCIEV